MLSDFIHIRQRLEEAAVSAYEIEGILVPDANEIEIMKRLEGLNCIENFVQIDGKNKTIREIKEGNRIHLKLYSNHLGGEKYYETFKDLLKTSNQSYPINRFYIHELKFDSNGSSIPDEIKNYKDVTKLVSFLKSISDYQKEDELVFFQTKKLVITTQYEISDIKPLHGIDDLIRHIQDSADKEERKIIFINELTACLFKIPEISNRFSYLLKIFEDITSNYKNSHSLYLEKYSYQKFKSEIDKEILEYSKKIQAVINDAQTKLVAIPAAFLLIVGQFDLTGEKLFFNIALFLSALIFSGLLEILLRNQFSALNFVEDDVKRFQETISEKKAAILGNDFTTTFEKINKLHQKQRKYLNIIRCLIWLTPIFALCLLGLSLINNTFVCIIKTLFYGN